MEQLKPQESGTGHTESAEWWNKKAKSFYCYERRTRYADQFIKYCQFLEDDTVLDMGCGSGTICVPLSDEGHKVVCADFSDGMLASMQEVVEKEEQAARNLTLMKVAWEDDWDKANVPMCDVAISSRSFFNSDPERAFAKLASRARRRVCATIPVNSKMFKRPGSPYEMGTQQERIEHLQNCLNAVFKLGYYPELRYMADFKDGRPAWAFVSFDK